MYLETILILSQELPAVRSIDVADRMGYSKPSVSRAVGILKNVGMIEVDKSGYITLTDSEKAVAEQIYDRHKTLAKGLMLLGVDEKTAQDDACRIEHYISEDTFEAIKKHLEQMQ
jgi:Mn-dependent DtxR family transcriptional regulator